MTGFRIRAYRSADAEAVSTIYVRAITGLAGRCYSPEQVAAWAGNARTPEETDASCNDGRAVWVAVDEQDMPVAFIDLEADGHIDMMFCVPEYAGRGVASALYRELEAAALARGLSLLHVEASEVAKPVFGHWGFTLVRRNDLTIDGLAIHNYAMEKQLPPPGNTQGDG